MVPGRHVDCDGNEGEVGESLRLIFKEKVIERQDLHFTSQLMPKDCHPAGAKKAVDGTLLTLGLDYVDLFIIHWPHGRADDFEVGHSWPTLPSAAQSLLNDHPVRPCCSGSITSRCRSTQA